ncbi:hypothetical protein [Nisaea sediminum]|uniref:hypothetical protein n=1 Tax=Nisaea sediminum TaxID=2775867 RepID=UPI001D0022CE|nr:hypothetical protein [Nisaea sediminum]
MTHPTAERTLVLVSHQTGDGHLCVDLIRRPDGSFGFEEYRRDPDDGHGWYPIGGTGGLIFQSQEAALSAARRTVRWLDELLGTAD